MGWDGHCSVVALAKASKKGIAKEAVVSVRMIRNFGVEGDAHAGPGPRQVSILDYKSISDVHNRLGAPVSFGMFAENVVVGASFEELTRGRGRPKPGDLLALGQAVLEVTEVGKQCHKPCAVRERTGNCIMAAEGVFARVVAGGLVRQGDEVRFLRPSSEVCIILTAKEHGTKAIVSDKAVLDALAALAREVIVTPQGFGTSLHAGMSKGRFGRNGLLKKLAETVRFCTSPTVLLLQQHMLRFSTDLLRILLMRYRPPAAYLEWRGYPLSCVFDRQTLCKILEQSSNLSDLRDLCKRAGAQVFSFSDLNAYFSPFHMRTLNA